ncbi:MAG: thioesterase [Anaerolineae bacterium]|nr:acyl-[acyl-carrier-protein] thioesterase [Caldilineales bacterium]MCX7852778.1 acyl-[acyl-carrier-protein] thioesterase [Caldilineales bacterium]MDW8269460.1 thioesterase [Anaerolineae bacterium]
MNDIFIWRTRTYIYEIDAFGHVNNAVYWQYLQQATVGAHPRTRWRLRRLQIEYLTPALYGDELDVLAWPESRDPSGHLTWGYLIRRPADGRELVAARATWDGDDATVTPLTAPVAFRRPKALRLTAPIASSHTFRWQHIVRDYEPGADGLVPPAVHLQWIEEAKFSAAAAVGWSPERMAAADFVTVQLQHETEWYGDLGAGAEVTILSRLVELRRLKGTWRHEVYSDGRLVALDYSHGAFLDRSGHPRPAPSALLTALLTGERGTGDG